MIVSEEHRYVYIAIPKAGSQSVSRWLVDNFAGTPAGYHHAWRVPPKYADYFVFTVVRDPYERCFSAWWYRCMRPGRGRRSGTTPSESFRAFMRSASLFKEGLLGGAELGATEARMTQRQFADMSGVRLAVRLESPGDFALLPFAGAEIPPLPILNKTGTKPACSFHDYFSGDEERLVWEYCAEDFEVFGYRRRPVRG